MEFQAGSAGRRYPSPMNIDHIVLGIRDRAAGIEELRRLTGVEAAIGGDHPQWGTRNALTHLGARCYLEILAPGTGPLVDGVAVLPTLERLAPVAWALEATDLDEVERTLEAEGVGGWMRMPGARIRPDRVRLSWELLVITDPDLPTAPFFIAWGSETPHPSEGAPTGLEIEAFSVLDPEPSRLTGLLDALESSVPVETGVVEGFDLEIRSARGGAIRMRTGGSGDAPTLRLL